MAAVRSPNIVLITTDQQRYDAVGYSGRTQVRTPAIDAFAGAGVRFDAAYTPCPICVPARASLLTGQYVATHGARRRHLQAGCWTFVRALLEAGYHTAAVGKMHFDPLYADHGFASMRLAEHDPMVKGCFTDDDYHRELREQGLVDEQEEWQFPSCFPNASEEYRSHLQAVAFPYPEPWHSTAWIGREAVRFLERRGDGEGQDDQPYFLWISFLRPHHPFNPPHPYDRMYLDLPLDLPDPATGWQSLPEPLHPLFARRSAHGAYDLSGFDAKLLQRIAAYYYGAITHIDDWVGRILEHIDSERTLVAFTSDHGEYLGHRGRLLKDPQLPLDDLARVPLAMRWPGQSGPTVVTQPVSLIDLAPTFLEAAGVPCPSQVEGASLQSLAPGIGQHAANALAPDRPVYTETYGAIPTVMVRRGDWKLIGHKDPNVVQLYNLHDDPLEQRNLAGCAEVQGEQRELAALLPHWST